MTSGSLLSTSAHDRDLRPTGIAVPGAESLAFAYDAANLITGITNGGSASLSQTLGYDALSRLTSVALGNGGGTASYACDADGNRVSQLVGWADSGPHPEEAQRCSYTPVGLPPINPASAQLTPLPMK